MDDLREALRRALQNSDFFDEQLREQLEQLAAQGKLDELIDKLMERLEQANYISSSEPWDDPERAQRTPGQVGQPDEAKPIDARFEVTDKSLDFLGFKTLRDLLGSLGKSSYGRHDTRHWATGIETSGASQRYEFGNILNLDTTTTLTPPSRAKVSVCRSISSTKICMCTSANIRVRAPRWSCSTAHIP